MFHQGLICLATTVLLVSPAARGDPGDTDENGCHGGPDAYHCHGGGASAESLLVVAAAVAGTVYLVRKARERRRLRRTEANAPAPLKRYDDNRNGRISCREARDHGIAPVAEEHPAYPYMRDLDGDGIVCEGWRNRAPAPQPAT